MLNELREQGGERLDLDGITFKHDGVAAHGDARVERLFDLVQQAIAGPTTSAMFTDCGAVKVMCVFSVMGASIARGISRFCGAACTFTACTS